jgi:hypothetical protein
MLASEKGWHQKRADPRIGHQKRADTRKTLACFVKVNGPVNNVRRKRKRIIIIIYDNQK